MTKLAIFGASGQTGVHLVAQALKKGHDVKAIVRNAEKLKTQLKTIHGEEISEHKSLEIVKVDNIFDVDSLVEPLKDVNVVMSTLGFNRGSTGYEDATKAISCALVKTEGGCRRLIAMHSWFTEQSVRSECPFWLRWTLLAYIGPILDNMRVAEKYLEGQNDIKYSVILPAGLTSNSVSESDFESKEDAWHLGGSSSRIARADVARYMLKTMDEDLHHNKIVAIAMKK
jgi:biliverdin reductase/flavin reductase